MPINLRHLATQFNKLIANIVYLLSCCIPKRDRLWLFSAWQGQKYSDNPRFIYEYALNKKELDIFWLAKNKNLYIKLKTEGHPVIYAKSLPGIWLQLRAGVIIYTHSHWSEFYSFCIGRKTKRVQSWHGAPLKKIGYDDNFLPKNKFKSYISRHIFMHLDDRCDLIFATGKPDKNIFEKAFNVLPQNVVITGYPRNDLLATSKSQPISKPSKLLYMPTFRGTPGSEFSLLTAAHFNASLINKKLINNHAHLYIKLHPAQKLDIDTKKSITDLSNIHIIEDENDIYSILLQFDALITDYSSIFFDFLLSKKPIYMLPIDISTYLRSDREFYYDYHSIAPSEPMRSWENLIEYIFLQPYPMERYNRLTEETHFYQDSNSSQRAYEAIIRALKTHTSRNPIRPNQIH